MALLIRTDFSDDSVWDAIASAMRRPTPEGFRAHVALVDDPAYRGMTVEHLVDLSRPDADHGFALIVDGVTVREPEHPILVVDLVREPGRTFRAVPATVQSIENNLSIANLDFADFADAVDDDGTFRGF